jgi:hypothetical protein
LAIENATIVVNESVNQTVSALPAPIDYAINTMAPRIKDLVLAPFENPDMLWTLAPMIIALVLMQLYFGRNKDESLGWNTAFGNSIALIFISASLLRGVFIMSGEQSIKVFLLDGLALSDMKMLVVLLIFAYGVFLAMLSFFHWIPEKVAFFIMNGISINVTAYVGIVLVISGNIPLDRHTLSAGVVIFLLVYVLSIVLRSIIPQSDESKAHRLQRRVSVLKKREAAFHRKAGSTGSGFWKNRYESRAGDYKDKINELEKIIRGLK